jgi:outer membrane biosynthesis protein TonB
VSSIPPKKEALQAGAADESEESDRILQELEADRGAVDHKIEDFAADFPLNTDISDEERKLLDNIGRSEQELDGLQEELRAADDALQTIADTSRQYEALVRVCSALEELDELGARHLFWGGDSEEHAAQLVLAHQRIESFEGKIQRAEEHRLSILEKIGDHNLMLDSLDTHLRDAMEREERRRAEWIVEGDPRELSYREQVLPWARGTDEDSRFRQALGITIIFCLLLGWLLPMIDIPTPLRSKLTEVPERVANLIRQEQPKPPPPPVMAEEPPPEEQPPEPVPAEDKLVEEVVPAAEAAAVAAAEQVPAQENVRSKGILAFRDSFATAALDRPNAQLGARVKVSDAGAESVGRPERSMVTTSAPGSSGGINLSDISRDLGGGGQAIEGVAVTQVASSIGVGDGPDRPLSAGLSAGRTDEEIQIVFDRYKAALYRLYNRELRRDPTLRGQLVLRLTIEPDGSVSMCEVQSSDMDAPALAQQVVERVRGFDFGAKEDIVAITIVYPIDFLPAG